jgi:hypothetical protein
MERPSLVYFSSFFITDYKYLNFETLTTVNSTKYFFSVEICTLSTSHASSSSSSSSSSLVWLG